MLARMRSDRPELPNSDSLETSTERALRLELRALEARLRELEASHRSVRRAIEEELRREHWGRLPDGWREHPDG
jgi:hypothetical protein